MSIVIISTLKIFVYYFQHLSQVGVHLHWYYFLLKTSDTFLDLSVPNSFDYILDIVNVVLCIL